MVSSRNKAGSAANLRPNKGGATRVSETRAKLRDWVVSGELKPGDKLPTEAALTQEYDVSRTVVREAVASLRAAGLVEVKHGVGVFVCEPKAPTTTFKPVDRARISSMIELLELRAAIEIEASGLAAERCSPAQEEALFERFDELNRLIGENKATAAADREFHLAIADATNNPRFRECLTLLGEHLVPRSALPEGAGHTPSMSYLEQIQEEHHAIIMAVSGRDPSGARQRMRAHLQGSKERYRLLIRGQ